MDYEYLPNVEENGGVVEEQGEIREQWCTEAVEYGQEGALKGRIATGYIVPKILFLLT